jgi:hypothetical protein
VDRDKLAYLALRVVGGSSIILGLLGLAYNSAMLSADYSSSFLDMNDDVNPRQFYRALYVMSGICVAFYVALIAIGVQLVRKNSGWVKGLLGIIIVEVCYYLTIGILWTSPQYGMSVAAASGVSSGGLSFQAFTLFPIWGPWVAFWASRRQRKVS